MAFQGYVAATAIRVTRASVPTPFVSILGGYLNGWRADDRTCAGRLPLGGFPSA